MSAAMCFDWGSDLQSRLLPNFFSNAGDEAEGLMKCCTAVHRWALSPARPRVPIWSLPLPVHSLLHYGHLLFRGTQCEDWPAWWIYRSLSMRMVCLRAYFCVHSLSLDSCVITCTHHCRILQNSFTGLIVLGYTCSPLPSSHPFTFPQCTLYRVSESIPLWPLDSASQTGHSVTHSASSVPFQGLIGHFNPHPPTLFSFFLRQVCVL